MENRIVNLNGQFVDWKNAKISVFDRGFLYGDSLYEVVRTIRGRSFRIKDHLRRLEKSASLCRMTLTQNETTLQSEMRRTIQEFRKLEPNSEVYCRLIITRGQGQIGFGQKHVETDTQFVVIAKPLPEFSTEAVQRGVRISVSNRIRNHPAALDPAMKSGNYLNNLLAYLEAEELGMDDAIMCNAEGHVTEGTTYNIWYLRRGILATPPLDIGILDGITRKKALRIAQAEGIPVREVRFSKERLYEADEIFITSTIKDIFPVTQVDQISIHDGQAGPVTMKLRELFQEAALAEVQNEFA